MSRLVRYLCLAVLLYVGGYIAFRQSHAEVWDRDKRVYVIFPLAYADAAMTGMQHHIGPHQ